MTLVLLAIVVFVCFFVTSFIYRKYWDYGLRASVSFAEKAIEEGEQFVLKETVENRKKLPLPTLVVKFEMDRNLRCLDKVGSSLTDKQYRNDAMSVMPYERVTRSIDVVGTKRGYYSIDEISYVTTDLLFQNIFTKTDSNKTLLYVYPARSRCVRLPEVICHMYGDYFEERMLWEDSLDFRGIRSYAPSDSMSKINWKASAKTGDLKVNQYHDSTNRRLTIFLNVSQKGILRYYDLIEESIRITRNFIEEFVAQGIPVRIISNGVDKQTKEEIYIREGAGDAHVEACLKQLARMDIYIDTRDMQELIQGEKMQEREVSLLISAEQTEELANAYAEYAGNSGGAHWLIPIHLSEKNFLEEKIYEKAKRGIGQNQIQTEYLVLEEMEG